MSGLSHRRNHLWEISGMRKHLTYEEISCYPTDQSALKNTCVGYYRLMCAKHSYFNSNFRGQISSTWINSKIFSRLHKCDKICIFVFKKSMELLGEDHYICWILAICAINIKDLWILNYVRANDSWVITNTCSASTYH